MPSALCDGRVHVPFLTLPITTVADGKRGTVSPCHEISGESPTFADNRRAISSRPIRSYLRSLFGPLTRGLSRS